MPLAQLEKTLHTCHTRYATLASPLGCLETSWGDEVSVGINVPPIPGIQGKCTCQFDAE